MIFSGIALQDRDFTVNEPKGTNLQMAAEAPFVEAHWVDLARKGDPAGWERLHQQYYQRLWRSVNQILQDRALAEDVVQEAFLKAYRTIHRFEGKSSFSTWIYRIATNQALDTLRKRNRRRKRLGLFPLQEKEDDPVHEIVHEEDSFREAVRADHREALRKAMAELPAKQRAVVDLRLVQGFSTDETAKILKCQRGTVLSRLYYSCQKLKKALEKTYEELG